MKKIVIVVFCAVFLNACAMFGGGGGGGGSSSGGNSISAGGDVVSDGGGSADENDKTYDGILSIPINYSDGGPATNTFAVTNTTNESTNIQRDINGISFSSSYSHNHSHEINLRFINDDFTEYSDYIEGIKQNSGTWNNLYASYDYYAPTIYNGNYTQEGRLRFYGNKMGLEYAEFGLWENTLSFNGTKTYSDYQGTHTDNVNGEISHGFGTFYSINGNAGFVMNAQAGNVNFSGKAIGFAYDNNSGLKEEIYGTANVNVDLSNVTANLTLNFDNFYTISAPTLDILGSSFNNYSDIIYLSNDTNNTTAITLDTNGSFIGEIRGDFYGNNTYEPTEVAGTIKHTQGYSSGQKGFVAAFGAKKD
ncbi:MAG: hypothetical protein LBL61_07015 [Elusimicrobiota bacterium]|jgi:hypothetical protein|nr:hypothetical protein [Elusimicrobiota bacterium]